MQYLGIYSRALGLLKPERKLSWFLAAGSFALSALITAQALLFAWTIAALTQSQGVLTLVLIFAALALITLGVQMGLTQQTARLAQRRRLAALSQFFEQALIDPSQKARAYDVMLRGADQLYLLLLTFFREHLPAFFTLMLITPVALWLSWQLSLLLVAGLALFSILNVFLARRALQKQTEVEHFHDEAASRAAEVLANAQVVQAYTRIEAETRMLDSNMQKLLSLQYPALDWFARKSVVFNACLALALIGLLALGNYLYGEARLGLFEILSFVGFILILQNRAEALTGFTHTLLLRKKPLTDFFTLLDAEAILKETPNAPALHVRNGQVEFRNVRFEGVSLDLTIKPDESVAIVDASGKDVSFIGALLLRTIEPAGGQILIDNQDITTVGLSSLRRSIALVGNDAGMLLNRSVMENLTLGKPHASQDEVIAAVQAAGAHDFIGALPDGFHTLIKNDTLTASEQERLAIARALLKDAKIAIVNEAEGGDDDSDVIGNLLKGRTALLFPRRLATLQKADRIVVLDKGGIEESGNYEELAQKKGAFAKLVSEGHFLSPKIAKLSDQQKKRIAATGE